MKKLIDLTENKDFLGFKKALFETLNEKASSLFISEESEEEEEEDLDFLKDLEGDDGELNEEAMEFILETMTEEEYEQLDELSQQTLMSYAQKSRKSRDTSKNDDTVGKRVQGLAAAIRRNQADRAKPQYK